MIHMEQYRQDSIYEAFRNYSKLYFGLDSDTLRIIDVSGSLISLILSIFGNIFILYAIWKKAIRLNKITVVLIQIIAITDLGITAFKIFPMFITSAVDRWILGALFCHIQYYFSEGLFRFSMTLICLVNVTKAASLVFPFSFRATSFRKLHGYAVAGATFMIVVIWMITLKFYCIERFWFATTMCVSDISVSSYQVQITFFYVAALYFITVNSLVLSTSCFILLKAYQLSRRSNRTINKEGIAAVLLLSGFFLILTLPQLIGYMSALIYRNGSSFLHKMHFKLSKFGSHTVNLNSIGNFFIYFISIKSFKLFVNDNFSKVRSSVSFKRAGEETRNISQSHELAVPSTSPGPLRADV